MNGKGEIIKEWIDNKGVRHRIMRFESCGRKKEAEYIEVYKDGEFLNNLDVSEKSIN